MTDLEPLSPEEGVDRFLEHRAPSVRESTLSNARTRLRFFLEWCDREDIGNLNDLTGRLLAEFVEWRGEQLAAISLQKQVSTLRVACRFWADIEAVEEGLAEKIHAPELPDGSVARDIHLEADRADAILEALDRYAYASREHVVLGLLWRTGMRRGALHAIDVDDYHPDDAAIELVHRPETDTPLKNGADGERWVYLGPTWSEIVEDYIANPDRYDIRDDYGRWPLVTTAQGRASENTIYSTVHRATQPCRIGDCPHGRDPDDCEAVGGASVPYKCPSSVSPHAVRRGTITAHLNDDVPTEIVSERADVSVEVLYQHYDARTQREKMDARRRYFK